MKKLAISCSALSVLLAAQLLAMTHAVADTTGKWDKLSTVLSVGAPVVAGFNSWRKGDDEGVKDLGLSLFGTLVIDEAIKNVHKETRPDGSGNDSFPSNHAAISFATARYVDIRDSGAGADFYYAAAVLTSYARVQAKQHYWRDTIAGGGIGILMSGVATDPKSTKVMASPLKGGMAFTWLKPLE
jgi:membrane-associated phospholipid phosphatase